MAHNATVHIKIDPEEDRSLSEIASRKRTSKGQLIREAISACYQTSWEKLPLHQQRALAAYQGGFISIGRLARAMGMHVVDLRNWLKDHDIPENSCYTEQDVINA